MGRSNRAATGRHGAAPSCGELARGFCEIGLLGFGGVLPWARWMVVEQRRWLTGAEFTDLLALCQFLPGPNVVNLSVALGARFQGARGALASLAGNVDPHHRAAEPAGRVLDDGAALGGDLGDLRPAHDAGAVGAERSPVVVHPSRLLPHRRGPAGRDGERLARVLTGRFYRAVRGRSSRHAAFRTDETHGPEQAPRDTPSALVAFPRPAVTRSYSGWLHSPAREACPHRHHWLA